MLYYALVFFIIAIIAAVFGFGGIAAGAVSIAKILFVIFLILTVVSLIANFSRRVEPIPRPRHAPPNPAPGPGACRDPAWHVRWPGSASGCGGAARPSARVKFVTIPCTAHRQNCDPNDR
jgi:uncharacterized membrane protein YtjA (UPF0391 family)